MVFPESHTSSRTRLKVVIRGAVQGVGFRPFVYRLATEMKIVGWVTNSSEGVSIEVEAAKEALDKFIIRLEREKPPRAFIQSFEFSYLDPVGFDAFEIRKSVESGVKSTLVLPDIATCPECLADVLDPMNRRYCYPFTNCTNCGPRFSIIEALPYDRPNTSMKKFRMCPECQKEYEDPANRRFHAQPNACPKCGPHLELWNEGGRKVSSHQKAIEDAANAVKQGKIVSLKGIGGFQLIVDARNDLAVQRLREKKHREEKPFALMYSSLKAVSDDCEVSDLEERALLSPEAPIVLLKSKPNTASGIAASVAPRNPSLGVMLPYTPLHHLLMRELRFPVVATSGNLSDEPICIDEREAVQRLGGIADFFLFHDRPIVRHVDDSIVRVMLGRELVLRRARGYAPLPVVVKDWLSEPSESQDGTQETFGRSVLAVGAHLKNTVALSVGHNVFVSQHIGDLETPESLNAFHRVIEDLRRLYDAKPAHIVCDLHPDYHSTQFAQQQPEPLVTVQHHYAHVAGCMGENQLDGELLGVSWDGTGLGLDGTIWGGEFLLTNETSFDRAGWLRPFPLPGAERAIKEPHRSAVGLLYEMYGADVLQRVDILSVASFNDRDRHLLAQMLINRLNSPVTSSAGRLFDAVASLVGLRHRLAFEGQAAMELEYAATNIRTTKSYYIDIQPAGERFVVDWAPMVEEILRDVKYGVEIGMISAKFHNSLAQSILQVALRTAQTRIVLTGGCFQNKYLTERTVELLTNAGLKPYWHQRIPPNDGGISLGQIAAYQRQSRKREKQHVHAEETG